MQKAIQTMVALGPMPSALEFTGDPDEISVWHDLLLQVQEPISDEEALALSGLFGPDSCFGLAHILVRILEKSPRWPVPGAFDHMHPEWSGPMMSRIRNRDDISIFGDIKDLPSDFDENELRRELIEYIRENYPGVIKDPEKGG